MRRAFFTLFFVACGGTAAKPVAPVASLSPASTSPVVTNDSAVAASTSPVAAVAPKSKAVAVAQIAANDDTTCALLADGTVRCWGDDDFNVVTLVPRGAMEDHTFAHPMPMAGVGPAKKVVVGDAHACALGLDGDVKCWGTDDGALGLGTPLPPGPPPSTPQPASVVGLHGVVELAGHHHLCAKVGDGSVSCWHDYDSGTGDPRDAGSRKPVLVPLFAHAAQLADGGNVSCARFDDGKAKCFRDVSPGLIPKGKVRVDPTEVPQMGKVVFLAAGDGSVCGITAAKTVRCWGQPPFDHPSGSSWKTGAYPIAGLADVNSIALGRDLACAIVGSGDVVCDHEDYSKPHRPTKIAGVSDAIEVTVGSDHACALTTSAQVYCWGRNDKGQLGDGTMVDRADARVVSF